MAKRRDADDVHSNTVSTRFSAAMECVSEASTGALKVRPTDHRLQRWKRSSPVNSNFYSETEEIEGEIPEYQCHTIDHPASDRPNYSLTTFGPAMASDCHGAALRPTPCLDCSREAPGWRCPQRDAHIKSLYRKSGTGEDANGKRQISEHLLGCAY
jgi:hypothetical protein